MFKAIFLSGNHSTLFANSNYIRIDSPSNVQMSPLLCLLWMFIAQEYPIMEAWLLTLVIIKAQ